MGYTRNHPCTGSKIQSAIGLNPGTCNSAALPAKIQIIKANKIKMPAMEIAGLCLPLKPQKEKGWNEVNSNISLVRLNQ